MKFKDIISRFQDIFFYTILQKTLSNCNSVLDIGCGSVSPLHAVRKTFYSEGIDVHKQSILESKKNKIHDNYRVGRVEEIDKYYKPGSFDAVIALDVIEHFQKKEALELIKKMEKTARKKIVILTPNGFRKQGEYDNNPYQVHKSGWSYNDLNKLGYSVYGLRGPKALRKEYATIRFKPWFFWGFISFTAEPMLFYFPRASYHFFAVKNLKNGKNK